jgi:hypothetical protein
MFHGERLIDRQQALRNNKIIGTLAWVIHVGTVGTLISPLEHLMHYPIPDEPVDKFDRHVCIFISALRRRS